MTLKAVTYYEISCDEDGCRDRPNDEYSAWADEDMAIEDAREAEWSSDGQGHHWCTKHTPKCPAGGHIREFPDDPCRRCRQWPEDDDPATSDATQEKM